MHSSYHFRQCADFKIINFAPLQNSHEFLFFCRFPFDWRTPFGYIVAINCQFIGTVYVSTTTAILVTFFVSICWVLDTFIEDITIDLQNFNDCRTSCSNDRRVMKRICDIVKLYAEVRQFSRFLLIFKIVN